MRRHWRWLLALIVAPVLGLALLVGAFEFTCGGDGASTAAAPYAAIEGAPGDTRPEAQTWLTYPEWHIVYSAESYASALAGSRPSRFAYGRDIGGFWSAYCAVNRATAGMPARGEYKTTIYTIGVSYTLELGAKAAYEWTVGRAVEALFGADTGPDRYSAAVQADYGAFLHETPWYEYPFGDALDGLWRVPNEGNALRAWERRFTLSSEYASKAVYARVLGAVVGATGHDERTLRLVARATPEAVRAIDARLVPLREPRPGLVTVEAPRYEQFTELVRALAHAEGRTGSAGGTVDLVEIAGNDDIFVTVLLPLASSHGAGIEGASTLFVLGTDSHPGFERAGLTVRVPDLLAVVRRVETAGGALEHVYDY